MRGIKFRAWDRFSGVMVFRHDGWSDEVDVLNEVWNALEGFEYEVMQYTGLKDANGVEIYEGDIVYHKDTRGFNDLAVGVVEWCSSHAQWRHSRYSEEYLSGDRLEVIGNIYENPELIDD